MSTAAVTCVGIHGDGVWRKAWINRVLLKCMTSGGYFNDLCSLINLAG